MHIHVNGAFYRGAPADIVRAMQHDRFTMSAGDGPDAYIAFVQGNLRRWMDIDLRVGGKTEAARAQSFLLAMVERGLAVEAPDDAEGDPKGAPPAPDAPGTKDGAPQGKGAPDKA